MAASKGKKESVVESVVETEAQAQEAAALVPLLDKGYVSYMETNPITGKLAAQFVKAAWPSTNAGKLTFLQQCQVLNPDVYPEDMSVYDVGAAMFGCDRESLIKLAAKVDEAAAQALATYKQDNSLDIITNYVTENGVDVKALAAALKTALAAVKEAKDEIGTHQAAIGKLLDVNASDVQIADGDHFYVPTEAWTKQTRTPRVYNWMNATKYTKVTNSKLYGKYTVTLERQGNVTQTGKGKWKCTLVSDVYGTFERSCDSGLPSSVYVGTPDSPGVLIDLDVKAVASGNVKKGRKVTASAGSDFKVPYTGKG